MSRLSRVDGLTVKSTLLLAMRRTPAAVEPFSYAGVIGLAMMVVFVSAAECVALTLPLRVGAEIRVVATAYCQQGATESGAHTRHGIIAADPHVLEVGSLVRILDGSRRGIYTVLDTGGTVKGFTIDIFIRDCGQAKTFGKRPMRVRVLRRGPE